MTIAHIKAELRAAGQLPPRTEGENAIDQRRRATWLAGRWQP